MFPAVMDAINQGISAVSDSSNSTTTITLSPDTLGTEEMQKLMYGVKFKNYNDLNVEERQLAFSTFKMIVCDHYNGTLIVPNQQIPNVKLLDPTSNSTRITFDCELSQVTHQNIVTKS